MKFAKILAIVIVCVSVGYGIYQVACEPGRNEQPSSPAITENGQGLVGEISSEVR